MAMKRIQKDLYRIYGENKGHHMLPSLELLSTAAGLTVYDSKGIKSIYEDIHSDEVDITSDERRESFSGDNDDAVTEEHRDRG